MRGAEEGERGGYGECVSKMVREEEEEEEEGPFGA